MPWSKHDLRLGAGLEVSMSGLPSRPPTPSIGGGLPSSLAQLTGATGRARPAPGPAERGAESNLPGARRSRSLHALSDRALHYNRFRYYDPSIGRYISADPIGQYFDINVYSYGYNNPISWIDPSGLGSRQQRPLDYGPVSSTTAGPLHHDSFRYEDGTNSGYYSDGTVRADDAPQSQQDKYEDVGTYLDDALLRQAEANVRPAYDQDINQNAPRYFLGLNDCQDYADDVEKEYNRLLSKPGGMSVAPPPAPSTTGKQSPAP